MNNLFKISTYKTNIMLTFIFSPIVLLQRFLSLFQLSAWNRTTKKRKNMNNTYALAAYFFSFASHINNNCDEFIHSWQFTGWPLKNEYKILVYILYVSSIFKIFSSIFWFKSPLQMRGFEKILVRWTENIQFNSSRLSNFTFDVD